MIRQILSSLTLAAALSGIAPSLACADQNDPQLDTLFGNLQQAETLDEASGYVQEIWNVWITHDDPVQMSRMNKGIRAMEDGDYAVAVGIFSNIIKDDPNFAEGWNKRATVYYLLGRVDESHNDVNRTLALEPRHFGALSGQGLLYAATGNLHKALRSFEEAIAVNPFMPSVQSHIKALRRALDEQEI